MMGLSRQGLLALFFCLAISFPAHAADIKLKLAEGFGRIMTFDEPVASIFIGSNAIAEVQAINETTLYVSGLKAGDTNLMVMSYNNDVIGSYTIAVVPPSDEIIGLMGNLIPRGSISVAAKGNTAVIQGNAKSVDEALGVLETQRKLEEQGRDVVDKTTTTAAVQVALRVRIVELYRRDMERLGFDISAIGKGSLFRVMTGTGIAEDFVRGVIGNAQGGVRAGAVVSADKFDLNAILDLLESRGVVEVLAEPMLTTTTGERATFRSGGEFAVSVNQGNGVFTAEYKKTGITIDFLPKVLPSDRISIEVKPEIVFVDPRSENLLSPSTLVRSVETKVEVASGQTFAIAGLYELYTSRQNSGAPGVGQIPVLGKFLTNSSKTKDERELIFFITPYLVKASSVVEAEEEPDLLDTLGFIVE